MAAPPPSQVLQSAPALVFLVGSLAVGLFAAGTQLAVASGLRHQGRSRTTSDDEWSSRRKSTSRLPLLPPSVFLVPVFVFYPLSGALGVTSIIKDSTSLHNASVILDGMGRAGLWLSLHLLLPFVAPYSPIGIEWWFRRAVDGLLLMLFTGSTVTYLASPFVDALSGTGLVLSHGLALSLNTVVLVVVNFSNETPIQRTLVLAQLAAQASDIQGMVVAARGGAGMAIGRAACVVVWMALAGCWYTSSIITSRLLGDPIHLSPKPRYSPYGGGYGQVTSGSSAAQLAASNGAFASSSMDNSPTFDSPEIATPGPAHDMRFRPFKVTDMDYDDIGLAVSGSAPYKGPSYTSPAASSEGAMEVMTTPPRESPSFLSGLGLGSFRRTSKSTTSLVATSTGPSPSASASRIIDLPASSTVPLSTSPPPTQNWTRSVLRMSRRGSSPSLSVALASPTSDEDGAIRFDPFQRQDFGAIPVRRHETGFDSTGTTPRPTPTDSMFPAGIAYERRPSQVSLALPELALPPRSASRASPNREITFPAGPNYERRPSQTSRTSQTSVTSLVDIDLSFPVRSPSRIEQRESVSSMTPSVKLMSYSFPGPSTASPQQPSPAAVAGGLNQSRWSTSTSDQTFTKRDEWTKRDSYAGGSISGSDSFGVTPSRQDSLETTTSTIGPGGLRMADSDEEEHMDDKDKTPRAQRSPLSMVGSILGRPQAGDGGDTSPTVTRFGGDSTTVLQARGDLGRPLTLIKEESPSPKSNASASPDSKKRRPSRLDLSPKSRFRQNSPVSPKIRSTAGSPSNASSSPSGSFKFSNPFSPASPGTGASTSSLKPLLLRPRTTLHSPTSIPLNTSHISRPIPQSQHYPTSHAMSSSVSSTASGKIVIGQSPTATRGTFGSAPSSIDSPGPSTPTRPAPARGGRARAGTISVPMGASQLMVPVGEGTAAGRAGDRGSVSTVATDSYYEGVVSMVTSPGGRVTREEGGRKGSVPNLSNWV